MLEGSRQSGLHINDSKGYMSNIPNSLQDLAELKLAVVLHSGKAENRGGLLET